MKWKNKGHEFDLKYEIYEKQMGSHGNRIAILGAGSRGKRLLHILSNCFDNILFIDNDCKKQGTNVEGIPIVSISQYCKGDGLIIISPEDEEVQRKMISQLNDEGFGTDDYYLGTDFLNRIYPIMLLYRKNKVYIPVVELSLTERCTLKCKKCAHGCQFVPMDHEDMSFETAKNSVDHLFSFADYVGNFYLIGGETFLYKQLRDIICYVSNNYRNQIENIMISTNGTIIPSNDILESIKEHDVIVNVSNYTLINPSLCEKHDKFINILNENGCRCNAFEEEREWTDYGFDFVNRSGDEKELLRVFDLCPTLCREIRDNKFYYCIQARAVSENMRFDVEDEYLDLSKMIVNDKSKRVFFEYANGYSERGFLGMCNYCNGAENNKYIIPAGEQMRK